MNKQQREQYSLKNSRRLKRWERLFVRPIYKVLQAPMKKAADVLRERGEQALRDGLDEMIIIEDLGTVLQRLHVFVGVKSARRVTQEINASVRLEKKVAGGVDEKWVKLILEYLKLYLLTKAVIPISAETKRRILEVLDKGISEGWSIDRMATELETDTFTLVRARLIARTEILKAQFFGENIAQQESEWETTKQWIAAKDHRTRHSHRTIDGETIDSDGKFAVDRYRGKVKVGVDMMEGPGDPKASAENVIQCRCTRAIRAARDERGRLIPKKFNRVGATVIA